jgi:hypothetical protein
MVSMIGVTSGISSADSNEPSGDCGFVLLSGEIKDVSQVGDKVYFSAPTRRMGTYQIQCDGEPMTLSTTEAVLEIESLPVYDGLFRFEFGHRESFMTYYDEDAGGLVVVFGDIMTIIEPGLYGYGIISRPGLQQLWIDDRLVGETHKDLSNVALWSWNITVGGENGELSSIMTYAEEEFLPGIKVLDEPVVVDPTLTEITVQCTGSMNPSITCLDTVMVRMSNIHPRDIQVGTAVVYTPFQGCLSYAPGILVLHRVVEVRTVGAVQEYLTQGDNVSNNTMDDGCWLPFSSLNGYVVSVEKGTDAEGLRVYGLVAAEEAENLIRRRALTARWLEVVTEEEAQRVCTVDCSNNYLDSLRSLFDAEQLAFQASLDCISELRAELQAIANTL